VTFTSDGCHLVDQDDGQLIGYGTKGADGLCVLMVDVVHQSRAYVAAESSVNLWHARLVKSPRQPYEIWYGRRRPRG
jgi:hypothetical protein